MVFGNPEFSADFLAALIAQAGLSTVGLSSIKLYKNAVPSDAEAQNFDPTTRSSDLLGTFTNCSFTSVGSSVILNTFPTAINTPIAGMVTWAYIQGQNGVGIVVEAGVLGGTGALILDKTALTAGGTVAVVDFGLTLTFY